MTQTVPITAQPRRRRETNLGALSQVPPGEGRNFRIGAFRVAIFHTRRGEVFATEAECPHRLGPLADGLIGGSTLVCPLHGWKFELATGQTANGECGLTMYPVTVSPTGDIMLTLPEL